MLQRRAVRHGREHMQQSTGQCSKADKTMGKAPRSLRVAITKLLISVIARAMIAFGSAMNVAPTGGGTGEFDFVIVAQCLACQPRRWATRFV
jgi:hypothetical protein